MSRDKTSIKIRRVLLDVSVPERDKAQKYFNVLSEIYALTLEDVLKEELEKYERSDRIMRIEKLELNLGTMRFQDLRDAFAPTLRKSVRKWLDSNFESYLHSVTTKKLIQSNVDLSTSSKDFLSNTFRFPSLSYNFKSDPSKSMIKLFTLEQHTEAHLEQLINQGFSFEHQNVSEDLRAFLESIFLVRDFSGLNSSLFKGINLIKLNRLKSYIPNDLFIKWILHNLSQIPTDQNLKIILDEPRIEHLSKKSESFKIITELPDILSEWRNTVGTLEKHFLKGIPRMSFRISEKGIPMRVDGLAEFRKLVHSTLKPIFEKMKEHGFDSGIKLDLLSTNQAWNDVYFERFFHELSAMPKIDKAFSKLRNEAIEEVSRYSRGVPKNVIKDLVEEQAKNSWSKILRLHPTSRRSIELELDRLQRQSQKKLKHENPSQSVDQKASKNKLHRAEVKLPSAPVGKELFKLVSVIYKMIGRDGKLREDLLRSENISSQMMSMLKLLELQSPVTSKYYREVDFFFYVLDKNKVPIWLDPTEHDLIKRNMTRDRRIKLNQMLEDFIKFRPAFIPAFYSQLDKFSKSERDQIALKISSSLNQENLFEIVGYFVQASSYAYQVARQAINKSEIKNADFEFLTIVIREKRQLSIYELLKNTIESRVSDKKLRAKLYVELDIPESWKEILMSEDMDRIDLNIGIYKGRIEKFKIPNLFEQEIDALEKQLQILNQDNAVLSVLNNVLYRIHQIENEKFIIKYGHQLSDSKLIKQMNSFIPRIQNLRNQIQEKIEKFELIGQIEKQLIEINASKREALSNIIEKSHILIKTLGEDIIPREKVIPIIQRNFVMYFKSDKLFYKYLNANLLEASEMIITHESRLVDTTQIEDSYFENVADHESKDDINYAEIGAELESPKMNPRPNEKDKKNENSLKTSGNEISTKNLTEFSEDDLMEEFLVNSHIHFTNTELAEEKLPQTFKEKIELVKRLIDQISIIDMLEKNWSWVNEELMDFWEQKSGLKNPNQFNNDLTTLVRILGTRYRDFMHKIKLYAMNRFENNSYSRKTLLEFFLTFVSESNNARDIVLILDQLDSEKSGINQELAEMMTKTNFKNKINSAFDEEGVRRHKYRLLWDKYGGLQDIPIVNAGLVILWPFLNTMFKKLNYFDESGYWLNKTVQSKAVVLLHYLCSDQEEYEEQYLIFNKVLCGYPIDEPIETGFVVTQNERKWVKKLLQNTIKQWPALKKTSIESLKGSFLMRNGVLYHKDESSWLLKIEKKPYDILLTKLPWSFKMIRLRWTIYTITVDWEFQIS